MLKLKLKESKSDGGELNFYYYYLPFRASIRSK